MQYQGIGPVNIMCLHKWSIRFIVPLQWSQSNDKKSVKIVFNLCILLTKSHSNDDYRHLIIDKRPGAV